MSRYSRSHEREERTKMGRGMLTSVFALFFCWIPVLGLLLACIGFFRIISRVTEKYRARFATYLTASLLILALCVAVLLGEVWLYCRNPNLLSDTGMWLFQKVTGQDELPMPTEAPPENYYGGVDYSDMNVPGMGLDPSLYGNNWDDGYTGNEYLEDDYNYDDDSYGDDDSDYDDFYEDDDSDEGAPA